MLPVLVLRVSIADQFHSCTTDKLFLINIFRKNYCPVCRQRVGFILLIPASTEKIKSEEHYFCPLNNPIIKRLLAGLNEQWMELMRFMVLSQIDEEFQGAKGIEHLNLSKFENEGRLLIKDLTFAVVQTRKGHNQVIFFCLLPNVSIRLVITEEQINVETDDADADDAVECLNRQLKACWLVLSRSLNKEFVDFMFIRKFERVTCFLVLCGGVEHDDKNNHCEPVREQLLSLQKCNFKEIYYNALRNKVPPLILDKLKVRPNIFRCKCG